MFTAASSVPPAPLYRRLMIAAVILAIIVAALLALPKITTAVDSARHPKVAAAKADIAMLMQGLTQYRARLGVYPTQAQGLLALALRPVIAPVPQNWEIGGYVDRIPHDPWGHPYQYRMPGLHQDAEVYSLGPTAAPGLPGGEEDPPDVIGSWQ